jgi:hypothetical protein
MHPLGGGERENMLSAMLFRAQISSNRFLVGTMFSGKKFHDLANMICRSNIPKLRSSDHLHIARQHNQRQFSYSNPTTTFVY